MESWMCDEVFRKKLRIINNPPSCGEVYELQAKLAKAESLLYEAWEAGYDTGKEVEKGYMFTKSFEQWKKEKGLT